MKKHGFLISYGSYKNVGKPCESSTKSSQIMRFLFSLFESDDMHFAFQLAKKAEEREKESIRAPKSPKKKKKGKRAKETPTESPPSEDEAQEGQQEGVSSKDDFEEKTFRRENFSEFLDPSYNNSNNFVKSIFWIDKRQIEILKASVCLFMDATYRITNTDYKLVVFTTFSPSLNIINVGYALLKDENHQSYKWLLQELNSMYQNTLVLFFLHLDLALDLALALALALSLAQ